jgi:hypothetical protein
LSSVEDGCGVEVWRWFRGFNEDDVLEDAQDRLEKVNSLDKPSQIR